MSSGVLDERLMIRSRLQEAFKKIIFVSDHDFAQDQVYKKANQVLYARLKKLEDYLDIDRPRSVRDVIPDSHLTKYGMYQYDEGREMSYTSSIGCVAVHYPCIYKTDVIREPWMLPEVEQVFMHTLFNSSCNFKLYEAELEQLEKVDLSESAECCADDLHQVYPNVFPLFERTPGKSYFPEEASEEEVRLPAPLYFTCNSYGEAILKKRILSDVVRELWNTPKEETSQNVFRVYKSTLDNVSVEEDHFKDVDGDRVKSAQSERTLQSLVNSILELNEDLPKLPEISTVQEPVTPPVRRLYSDVVQGNKSPTKNHTDTPSPTPARTSTDDFLLSQRINSSHVSLSNTPISGLSPDKCGSAPEIATKFEVEEARCHPEFKANSIPENVHLHFPEASVKYSYSDAVNNISGYQTNQNMFLNEYPSYAGSTSNVNFQNFFSPLQYISNYAGNYRLGSYSNTFAGTLTNQQNRTNMNVNSCQHQWFFPTYRPPNICSYSSFLGQLILPQVPTNKTRWCNSQYSRPPTQQNVYQNWIYRSNSNQQMPAYSSYDQKTKPKKSNATGKLTRSKTPDQGAIPKHAKKCISPKILSKPNSDYKLMTRSTRSPLETDPNIPVSLSASDELEKIALREYQSSNDLFFTEIERQAQEQYDGNPENSCCPPNKHLCLGGLAAFIDALYIPTISTPHIYLLKLHLHVIIGI